MSDLASAIVAGLDDDALDALAERLAPRLESRWRDAAPADEGWMTATAAANYLGVKTKRIYDLTSMRVLVPDGRDGRTPLYTRATLEAYARSRST